MKTDLLPRPLDAQWIEGVCPISAIKQVRISGISDATLAILREDFPQLKFEKQPGDKPSTIIGDASPGVSPTGAQGYALNIAPKGIHIAANDAAGLFYAFQTLYLLMQDAHDLPCGTIKDHPAIKFRGFHIDLKGYQPKFPRLLEQVRLLARYKINAILLEIEDKFHFQSAPEVGISSAYTKQQMQELGRLCTALHIQLIPKLQCLGHVDYILRHKRYAHLRENNHPYQFCPRNDGAFELFKSMAKEIIECFPGHEYFHVGADESVNLGECPECRKYSKAASYLFHVGRCIDFIADQKLKPILWDDIVGNKHGDFTEAEAEQTWKLGEKAILMYWMYGYHGRRNEFDMIGRYKSAGLNVWGASGVTGCGPMYYQNLPPLRERALNVSAWTKSAVENNLQGVMATSWTRYVSFYPPTEPPDACWLHILFAAESTWSGRERNLADHISTATRSFYGADLSEIGEFVLDLDLKKLPEHPEHREVRRNEDRYELLCAALSGFAHENLRQHDWFSMYDMLHGHHGLLGESAADYAIDRFKSRLEQFEQSLTKNESEFRRTLANFYEQPTVDEVIRNRFGRDHQLVKEFRELLDKTKPW